MKVRIYTDGSCSDNPGAGGWAVVFNTEYECITISGNNKTIEILKEQVQIKQIQEKQPIIKQQQTTGWN